MERKLFPLIEACSILGGVDKQTLRVHARRGHIRAIRLGRRIFFDQKELDRISREGLPKLTAIPTPSRSKRLRSKG